MGTVINRIDRKLANFRPYQDFREGRLPRRDYVRLLERNEKGLLARGLTRDQIHLSGRFPDKEERAIDRFLADLAVRGVIAQPTYDKARYRAHRAEVEAGYDHEGYLTYIFPEETRLLYALAENVRPGHAVALGSYYGYWVAFALPAVRAAGGTIDLVDIDPRVCALAEKNLARFGFQDVARVVNQDVQEYLSLRVDPIDFAILDPEGRPDDPDPERRGKSIYHPTLRSLLPRLAAGAVVVSHNILLSNSTDSPYFAEKIAHYWECYYRFWPLAQRSFQVVVDCDTTEGVAVFARPHPTSG
jgi:predicted O-methyltransferase YrrM